MWRGFTPASAAEDDGLARALCYGAVAGLIGGLASACYRMLLGEAESFSMMALTGGVSPVVLVPLWIVGAVVIAILMEWEPLARRGGVLQVRDELSGGPVMDWWRVLAAKFAAGGLGIAMGMSLGRGGPSVQIGAAAGRGAASLLNSGERGRRLLVTAGAAAGLSATFNSPLAGAAFALESVSLDRSPPVILSVVVASQVAGRMADFLFGCGPLFSFGDGPSLPAGLLWHFLVLGVLCGAAGALFRGMMVAMDGFYKRVPARRRTILPALAALMLALLLPQVLAGGHRMIESITAGGYGVRLLLLLFAVKLAFTVLCVCSEAAGGLFYPMLAVGAALGALYAASASGFGVGQAYTAGFLVAGMAGLISAVMRAPVTGVLLVAEMTGTLSHLLPASATAAAALLVTDLFRRAR